jgi:hypothetical protein
MIISKIGLTLTEDDLNKVVEAAFAKIGEANPEAAKKVRSPKIVLKDGAIIFKCKASMGIMPVPIEARIELKPAKEGAALDVTLAKVSMMFMGGAMGASALMGQVATAVAGKPGLSVNGTTLTVDLALLADLRKITLGGKLNAIDVKSGTLALDFS